MSDVPLKRFTNNFILLKIYSRNNFILLKIYNYWHTSIKLEKLQLFFVYVKKYHIDSLTDEDDSYAHGKGLRALSHARVAKPGDLRL